MISRTTAIILFSLLSATIQGQTLTLEDIWKNGTYHQKSIQGLRSMKDGKHYTTLEKDGNNTIIAKYSYKSGKQDEVLLSEEALKKMSGIQDISIDGYTISADEKKMLIASDEERIYRHSTKAHFYYVDLKSKSTVPVSGGSKQRHATFSPDGEKVAFVQNNNIMVAEPAKGGIALITTDGEENKIINGYADWVYEEEFSFDKAFFWSPDGNKIAYYRFDESAVREFHLPLYNDLYPEDYTYKYPKAGEENSKVTIHVYDFKTGESTEIDLGDYEYIPRIKWTQNSDFLTIMKMPRLQNILEIIKVNTEDYSTSSIYREVSKTYIEISDDLTFFDDNAGFIWRSEKNGFFHLYRYDFNGGGMHQITRGDWEVKSFLGYDEDDQTLFFEASKTRPENTEVYSISLEGNDMKLLSPEEGSSHAQFSASFDYFILKHSTASRPLKVSLHKGDGTEIRVLEDNAELKSKLDGLDLADVEFFDFDNGQGTSLNGWMMKPTDFDPTKKYPVLMYVYGGPGSQTVTNAMGGNYLWHQLMAQKGYIIVSVDNRGTGARGKEFRTITYRQLGKHETEDQIAAAKWLAGQSYVDAKRIGIWGWSYGGYMSSLCLFKGAEHFKTAVAVAPVSNWRYYDSIYTERYMGIPQDNTDGYDENSPINHTDKMVGNYLMIHGTADDNVHFQNAVEMSDALIASDKQFDFYIYPDRNHGIYGGNTRHHLFTKVTNFLIENL